MIIYIDDHNKICFIAPPKCGNTSIANYLNLQLHTEYSDDDIYKILRNDDYTKIIVLRNPLDRFLSGFYEDLNNNSCYNDIDITFNEYCLFLNHCYDNKIKNVDNLNIYYKNIDAGIWWGNCSSVTYPITTNEGDISGHLISQYNCVKHILSLITGINVKVIDISNLNKYLNNTEIKNSKSYSNNLDINSTVKLSDLKKNIDFRVNKNQLYTSEIINIIKNIYKEDFDLIEELSNKYSN